MDTFRQTCESRRGEFAFKREKKTRKFTNRLANLRMEVDIANDQERLWVRKHRSDGDQIVALCGAPRMRDWQQLSKVAEVGTFNRLELPRLEGVGVSKVNRTKGRTTT
jgi:hypothetical protein